jgi:hypothetical protein
LNRLARCQQTIGLGVQHAARIAQAVNALVFHQQMGINPRHLRRDVGADAKLPACDLVGKADGFQR